MTPMRRKFTDARSNAKRRGFAFDLEFETYQQTVTAVCIYGDRVANGMDRINPDAGYTKGNVAPCCPRHNVMKGRFFTHEEMLFIVANVVNAKACGDCRGTEARNKTGAKGWKSKAKQRLEGVTLV